MLHSKRLMSIRRETMVGLSAVTTRASAQGHGFNVNSLNVILTRMSIALASLHIAARSEQVLNLHCEECDLSVDIRYLLHLSGISEGKC